MGSKLVFSSQVGDFDVYTCACGCSVLARVPKNASKYFAPTLVYVRGHEPLHTDPAALVGPAYDSSESTHPIASLNASPARWELDTNSDWTLPADTLRKLDIDPPYEEGEDTAEAIRKWLDTGFVDADGDQFFDFEDDENTPVSRGGPWGDDGTP